jgi:hypothetical protein
LHEQLEGWLHDLKILTLIAFRYREQHDFFNKTYNPFDESEDCPAGATPERQFQHANNLVMTAMRLELETFHIYTSTLVDRIARIYVPYFGERNAIQANTDESFWKQSKHRQDITYLTLELKADAKWLQDKVDRFRNQVVIHPEDRAGLTMQVPCRMTRSTCALDTQAGPDRVGRPTLPCEQRTEVSVGLVRIVGSAHQDFRRSL